MVSACSLYLTDHAFQNMGLSARFVLHQTALRLHREFNTAATLQGIEFRRPIIFSDEELEIKIDVREIGAGLVEYVFSETTEESWFARLEIADTEPTR